MHISNNLGETLLKRSLSKYSWRVKIYTFFNLKYFINPSVWRMSICITYIDNKHGYQRGNVAGSENQKLGINTHTIYIKWINPIRAYYIALGTPLNILWWPMWENNLKKKYYMYMHNWITLVIHLKLTQNCINKSTIL